MVRKLFRKWVPSRQHIEDHRLLRRLLPWLKHPNLWHLNRRSVAGGVAIGLFSGLVPGPLQMLCAAILAIGSRRNLPVALFTTFYTNPLTILPLYWLAFELGHRLLGQTGQHNMPPEPQWSTLHWQDWPLAGLGWLKELGLPLAVGLPTLALLLACSGYLLVDFAWRWHVRYAWRRRQQNRPSP